MLECESRFLIFVVKRVFMKKIIDKFLKKENTTLLKAHPIRFKQYVQEEHPNLNSVEALSFFVALRDEKKLKAKRYEETHMRKTIRFSKKEYEKISEQLEKAEIDNFSQWAKSVLLKKKIKLPVEQNKVIEIANIGSDLKQIANYISQNGVQDTPMGMQIFTKLVQIEKELKEL